MFKRFIILFVSFALVLVPCFTISVSAEYGDPGLNLLEYTDVRRFNYNGTYGDCTFSIPYYTFISGLDVVFSSSYTVDQVGVMRYGEFVPLDFYSLGGGYYRIAGSCPAYSADEITFRVYTADVYNAVGFERFVFYSEAPYYFKDVGSIQTWANGLNAGSDTMTSPTDTAWNQWGGNSAYALSDFYTLVTLTNWKKYDHLDVIVNMRCTAITGASVSIGTLNVPFEVSYINTPSDEVYDYDVGSSSTVDTYNIQSTYLHFTIDLTSINRAYDGDLVIRISGNYANNNSANYAQLMSVTGVLDPANYSQVSYWFKIVNTSISNGFSSLGSYLETGFQNVVAAVRTGVDDIEMGLVALGNNIADLFTDLTTNLSSWFNDVLVWFYRINENLVGWFDTLFAKLDQIINPDAPDTDEAISDAQQGISDITAIEDQYAADLDSQLVSSEVDKVQNYGNALVFCSSILSRSFNNLGGYQIIYILPVCIGIFLFVCSRVRVPSVPSSKHNESVSADALRQSHSLGTPSHSSMANEVSGQERMW